MQEPSELNHGSSARLNGIFKIANVFAFIGLIFFSLYYLTAFRFDVIFSDPARQVDFTIWRFIPHYIFEHGRYPAVVTGDWEHTIFQYLPSAAAMMLPLSWPPQPIGFAIWLLIETFSFALVLLIGLRLSGAARLQARWLIMIAAVLLSDNSLGWDFRNHNTNIVYLALVMLGIQAGRTWIAALMLALSINLKLYSGLIPVALAWRREYALAITAGFLTVLIAVLLPVLVFGPSASLQLAGDWVAQIRYSVAINSGQTASLIRSVTALLGVNPDAGLSTVTLRAIQGAWLALVICYYVAAARIQPSDPLLYNQARLADVCVALIAPLPVSIWFIPYHAVVTLPAYMLLLTVAISDDWPKWLRVTSCGACIAPLIVRFAIPDWNYRGAVFLVTFIILLGALACIRRRLGSARN